ncbi:hypothetical protein [Streptomyces chartreusis]|uniref:hypothetical protein n=1 Tax=Streptomyces chartreusis TaxID=1969 RepID=UPI00369EAC43
MTGQDGESAEVVRTQAERATSWSTLLRSMDREKAEMLLARALYGARAKEIAHGLGQSWSTAELGQGGAVWQATKLAADLQLFDPWILLSDGHYAALADDSFDEALRTLIREWRIEERFAPRCRQCEVPFARRASGGRRPREYCSNACRQKAYRRRSAAGHEPEQVRECHTPQDVDRALDEGREVVRCSICQPSYPLYGPGWQPYADRLHPPSATSLVR